MDRIAMFGANIYVLIGLMIVLAVLAFLVLSAWVTVKVLIWRRQRARAVAEWHARTRRADGRRYPPSILGVCTGCRRMDKTTYLVGNGRALCPACYEVFWREEESGSDCERPALARAADPPALWPASPPSP